MKPFLSVYGHVTIDQIVSVRKFPEDNTTEDILTKTTTLGGTGTNIAVSAARLGCPTALCTFVGRDFPAKYEQMMRDSGLIMDEFVYVDEYETSTAVMVNDPSLTQKVVFFQGPQGFADDLGIMLDSNAKKSDHVHFCTGQPSYYTKIMKSIRGAAKVAVDPAQESHRIWNSDNFPPALALADSLFCNSIEAGSLAKYIGVADIMDADVDMVVCTMGAQGSVARVGDERITIPTVKASKVVDATGCGDSFRGAYYTALYKGYDIPSALTIASSVASFVIEKTGALTNIPAWDDAVARAEPYIAEIS